LTGGGRVVLVQERGRHPANREFREALCVQRALERLGVEAVVWGLGYETFATPLAETARGADVVVLLENWDERGWLPDISRLRTLRVFWSIDSHVTLAAHVATCRRQKVHLLLNATERYLPHFRAAGRSCVWFPNAYPADLVHPLPDVAKAHDLGFCGNVLNRGAWIEALAAEFGMHVLSFDTPQGPNHDAIGPGMVRAVNSFRMHWNRNLADDINYRTFETLGCRTLLLTNHTPGLERLFDREQHLVVYCELEDLRARIRALLAEPARIERIAAAGHAHARAHHTYDVRARQLLELISAF
jgi:hypothetical protein